MSEKFKYFLVVIIALVLFVPLLQFNTGLINERSLDGGVVLAGKPQANKEDYWSGKWQEEYNKYINDNFGLRPDYIRLINQIRYSVFNTSHAPGVVIGKDGELFIESYIDEYIGRNYIGAPKISENVRKIKRLQDSMTSKGKLLLVVFAPGKASYMSENIPDMYIRKRKDSTNYNTYKAYFENSKVNFIDMNKWFRENKAKFKHPVFPKYGTHWNHYGMSLALDTILKYVRTATKLKMPEFSFDIVNYNTSLKGNDFDVGILLNPLFSIRKEANPYPVYKISRPRNFEQPNLLAIGDSYWWCIVGDQLPANFFQKDEYWFYNKDVYINNNKQEKSVKQLNFGAELYKRDVILLIATEATYYMFPYGFVDDAYKLYCEDHSQRYKEIFESIKNNPEWMNKIKDKALENGITEAQQLQMDADYVLSEELFSPKQTVESIMEEIRKDPKWFEEIKIKAVKNNLPLEQQLRDDATWVYNERNK